MKKTIQFAVAMVLLFITTWAVAATGYFTPTGAMGAVRYYHTATPLPNGQVLIAGGANSFGFPASSAELYDPATGTFTPTGAMGASRSFHTATLLPSGKVLITGGLDGVGSLGTGYLSSAELYDPATGTFAPTGAMGSARIVHTATLLPNGQILIAGGEGMFGYSLSSAELYDPGTGVFTPTGSLGMAEKFNTATLLPNGQILIAGGADMFGSSLSSAYDPGTGVFTPSGSLGIARYLHTATLLPNGQVLIAGGVGNSGVPLSSAELYDPATGTFTLTSTMGTMRWVHTATLLPSGQVLIAGGLVDVPLSSAELYDPATGIFTLTSTMGTMRYGHTATLLPSGQVLIAGGWDGSFPVALSELYTSNQPPVANAGADQNIYLGESATLSGALSTDSNGDPLTYVWTLDAAPLNSTATLAGATTMTPSLAPDVIGVYHLSLVVNDGQADSAASPLTITVSENLPPVAIASGIPLSGYAPLTVMFNAGTSYDPEGSALSYSWNFGDPASGANNLSAAMLPNHVYAAAGNYTAVVTVTDNFAKTDQASVAISVTAPNLPPVVLPTATPNHGASLLGVQFAANATDANPDDVLSYSWNFGDGSALSALANPQHTYSAGTYTATVTVSDGVNAPVSASLTISVSSALSIHVTEAKMERGEKGKVEGRISMKADFDFAGVDIAWMPAPADIIRVKFDGVTLLEIPFASFKAEGSPSAGKYEYETKTVEAELDFKRGTIKVSRHKILTSGVDNANGIDVEISFGAATGTDHVAMKGEKRGEKHERDSDLSHKE